MTLITVSIDDANSDDDFDALADRNGNGGYGSVPTESVAAGARETAGRWSFTIENLDLVNPVSGLGLS